MNTTASSDEKLIAALAHGSVFLMFLGPIIPVIVWATQRKKSKYVCFQALQAMGYQALIFWLWILAMTLVAIVSIFLFPFAGALLRPSRDLPAFGLLFQMPIFLTMFGLVGLSFFTGIAGAVACLLGYDFRYPLLGKWLGKYISYDTNPESQIVESQEENWVAAVCHATAILQLWGLVTPLIVWFSQKERSARLRFQSLQAFAYQAAAFAGYLLGMAIYMVFFFGMMVALVAGSAAGGNRNLEGPAAFFMLVFLAVIMVFWLAMLVLLPIYYILAAFASLRVLRGRHFRYPLLGRIVERQIGKGQTLEPET